MEENLSNGLPLAVTHLLQHTLRSLCSHETSQWVYAIFWRILPRNYPPPKWDLQRGAYDRILVWEDGFCNFAASCVTATGSFSCMDSTCYASPEIQQPKGLKPELFFKMSHEIYNYGEGLIGKAAADHSHKWIFKEPDEHEDNCLHAWQNTVDSYPRTWEAQFRSGIQTIALIAVSEGVLQLGSVNKINEDINYILLLRKKFSYIESIPGVLLPHPSSPAFPMNGEDCALMPHNSWSIQANHMMPRDGEYAGYFTLGPQLLGPEFKITPSMTSLEALLSKLPSVGPVSSETAACYGISPQYVSSFTMGKAKMEEDDEFEQLAGLHLGGESSGSIQH
ncbi:Transcription factor [Nymphaea thermarum]|nr:Transcription factor [Nymphaea thermarum]